MHMWEDKQQIIELHCLERIRKRHSFFYIFAFRLHQTKKKTKKKERKKEKLKRQSEKKGKVKCVSVYVECRWIRSRVGSWERIEEEVT